MENVNQADFWQQRYEQDSIGWDMGQVSPPLKAYIDQLPESAKDQAILVPGAGNAYEVGYLHEQGFTNVTLVDFAPAPIKAFAERYPDFPAEHLICADFFNLSPEQYQFDWVLEQTFFCAINPTRRDEYVRQMAALLKPKGKLVGLLFDKDFGRKEPPFGGTKAEYQQHFESHFDIEIMAPSYNSHPARQGSELLIKMRVKA
ncbi:methyltransferase domain-containing protein [Psychrobacter sp. AOP22-C1-22]|uniref:methyltransferase domain-containing protein n=1 Tax=unclassified Psychrobacter TaxID=196806 RepID=UPI0017886BB7|nr:MULTISPECIES: methyltransferase domain-containing protein [unclassified Psychrobacter]MDN5802295.1 TPMT family class I SAM-dependent methyltransferase [Psychrobacter sp.]MBE0407043.1 methyltransferase domain-containing protein [Psychrobacter sp. FME6]MBE0445819.1 methyltransferase domain-containing protein [Psychrobacter sp. FME5]MDN5892061.1 TPMT family class I SAM-dependent methyltransferase [Psychrobacter sp.]MDN5898228.1 TPMT family class I SAM-dependent methyltransferase [Psychrobacter